MFNTVDVLVHVIASYIRSLDTFFMSKTGFFPRVTMLLSFLNSQSKHCSCTTLVYYMTHGLMRLTKSNYEFNDKDKL